ncbi:MAG: hypothetical protein R2867_13150 [Caldilineaceae bacterium]
MTTFSQAIQQALITDQVIDITTIGRKSGEPRRIEIWFHNLDGRLYITGTPGRPRLAGQPARPPQLYLPSQREHAGQPAGAPCRSPRQGSDVKC